MLISGYLTGPLIAQLIARRFAGELGAEIALTFAKELARNQQADGREFDAKLFFTAAGLSEENVEIYSRYVNAETVEL